MPSLTRDSWVFLLFFASALLLIFWAFVRPGARSRSPAILFLAFYVVTSVIGATLMRLWPDLGAVILLMRGVNPTRMPRVSPWLYWALLYLPLLVVPLVTRGVEWSCDWDKPASRLDAHTPSAEFVCDPFTISVALAAVVLYCVITMAVKGFTPSPAAVLSQTGDYLRVIQQRGAMMATLGNRFYGVLYGVLPTISFIALYMALSSRRATWVVIAASAFAAVCWLSFATLQKSILIEYLVVVAIGLQVTGRARLRMLFGTAIGLLLTLAGVQSLLEGPWSAGLSILQVTFRMALGYPYYVGLFPGSFAYYGVDWQGLLFGSHLTYAGPDYNLVVSNAMWPNVPMQGAVPAPATVSAFAEGGIAYAAIVSVVIAVLLAAGGRAAQRARSGPYRFAFFLVILSTAYYLTQVSLLSAMWESYGIKWGLETIAVLAGANWLFRHASSAMEGNNPEVS